jgi:adenosylcobyric acid synthase
VRQVSGTEIASGLEVAGYEIHLGRTAGAGTQRPWLDLSGQPDGAMSADGCVRGCYVHGLFQSDAFRRAFLARLGGEADGDLNVSHTVEATLSRLADHLETHLDTGKILEIAKGR